MAATGDLRGCTAVVAVEGVSDRIALEAVAARLRTDLGAAGVRVVPVGGAHGIGRFLARLQEETPGVAVGGLCDAAEEGVVGRALEQLGLGSSLDRAEMERLGFFVCVADLEDELIRAHGAASVEKVLAARGDLAAFRTFQKQPAWRGRPVEAQLRRFLGSADSRKVRYARLLVDALDPAVIPRPLVGVLAAATNSIRSGQ